MSTSTNPESTNNIWKTLTDKTKNFIKIKEGQNIDIKDSILTFNNPGDYEVNIQAKIDSSVTATV